ncbi:MAG: hypothetical protein HZA50_07655 [Planctomycetes bacterium]|nr:hypothetical protein [Planctomycetota bacterium]
MKSRIAIMSAAAFCLVYAGCNGTAPATMPVVKVPGALVTVTPEVNAAVGAIGGLDAWTRINRFQANLVLTVWNADGKALVNRFRLVVNLRDSRLTAVTSTSTGQWSVSVTPSGGTVSGDGYTAGEDFGKLLLAGFQAILHDVGGPLNLAYREQAGQAQQVQISGNKFVRIPVAGAASRAIAYYCDPVAMTLIWMTAGADEPGQDGTVSVYTYGMLPNGMFFPSSIRCVKIGQYALIGKTLVFEADFSDVNLSE